MVTWVKQWVIFLSRSRKSIGKTYFWRNSEKDGKHHRRHLRCFIQWVSRHLNYVTAPMRVLAIMLATSPSVCKEKMHFCRLIHLRISLHVNKIKWFSFVLRRIAKWIEWSGRIMPIDSYIAVSAVKVLLFNWKLRWPYVTFSVIPTTHEFTSTW